MLETSATWAVMTGRCERQSPLALVWDYDGDRLTCRWITGAADEAPTTVELRPVA
jgi:hypothetical protein